MKLENLDITDQVCIRGMGKGDIAIFGVINLTEKFECLQVITKDENEYFFSLADEEIEDDQNIPEDVKKKVCDIVSEEGYDEIIDMIQENYTNKISHPELDGCFYDDIGKGNIKEYCKEEFNPR